MNATASVFLGPLQNLLGYFQRERQFKSEKKDAALSAINNALTETLKYLERGGAEKCFDRMEELRLANLWRDAAIKVRHVSAEMATQLNDKSLYWADHLEWSRDEVVQRKIDIHSIQSGFRALLSDA
jgi:hypothetical protein